MHEIITDPPESAGDGHAATQNPAAEAFDESAADQFTMPEAIDVLGKLTSIVAVHLTVAAREVAEEYGAEAAPRMFRHPVDEDATSRFARALVENLVYDDHLRLSPGLAAEVKEGQARRAAIVADMLAKPPSAETDVPLDAVAHATPSTAAALGPGTERQWGVRYRDGHVDTYLIDNEADARSEVAHRNETEHGYVPVARAASRLVGPWRDEPDLGARGEAGEGS